MDRATEIRLLKKLLHYVDAKTTSMAEAPWRNDVTAYTCSERHMREEEILIRKRPLVMGLTCDWSKPGAYRTDDFAGVPILSVRGSDGKLRAFLNVCRHRGAKVAQGSGTAGAFTCPYHGWTYGNDGVLRGLPEEATSFPGIRAERPGLTPLPLAEKYGMVWVMPTPAADRSPHLDIDPWLKGLEDDLASWKLDTYHIHDRHVHHEEMNWKLLVDTFHEGYHFGFLHKESLKDILVHNVGDFTPFGPNFRLVYGRTKLDRLKAMPESNWDLMWNTTIVYSMFANTIFSPQGDHMEIFRMFPVDGRTDRALMETSLYIPKPVETVDEKRHWDANLALAIKVITTEDFPASRTMQIGFRSGAQSHVIYGRNEPALAHYHKSIRRALGLPVDDGPVPVREAAE
jgi:phenylpropionate dioxygenase-like ring-hydroxylating dioxygenase large terminal subunit